MIMIFDDIMIRQLTSVIAATAAHKIEVLATTLDPTVLAAEISISIVFFDSSIVFNIKELSLYIFSLYSVWFLEYLVKIHYFR
jgi:hypothetical protein